jgi:Tfp pilus assembly protein PilF
MPAVQSALTDNDIQVRSQAVRSLEPLPPQDRVHLAAPLLTDPSLAVRIEVARLLAGAAPSLPDAQKTALDHDIAELTASEMVSAERPESHMNLALVYAQMGRTSDAENELKTALRLDPKFVPAMVNLADLYREQQRDNEGQQWLEKAIAAEPNAAEPIYALGLLKIRQKQYAEALPLLAKASALQPSNARYSYVYAVALQSSGQVNQAIGILQRAHEGRPADRQILNALVAFERDNGNIPAATVYAQQLVQLVPDDPSAKATLRELQRQAQ